MGHLQGIAPTPIDKETIFILIMRQPFLRLQMMLQSPMICDDLINTKTAN